MANVPKPWLRQQSTDYAVTQTNLEGKKLVDKLQNIPLIWGTQLTAVSVPGASNTTSVAHQLGRSWKGYIITRAYDNASSTVYAPSNPTNPTDLYLTVGNSSASTRTYDIWVY